MPNSKKKFWEKLLNFTHFFLNNWRSYALPRITKKTEHFQKCTTLKQNSFLEQRFFKNTKRIILKLGNVMQYYFWIYWQKSSKILCQENIMKRYLSHFRVDVLVSGDFWYQNNSVLFLFLRKYLKGLVSHLISFPFHSSLTNLQTLQESIKSVGYGKRSESKVK